MTKKPKQKPVITDRQIRAYTLVSGEFQGLSTIDAAKEMGISVQAFKGLMKRAEQACPQIFPILTKQEADVLALLALNYNKYDLANQLEVSLSRISQLLDSLHEKGRGVADSSPVKMLRYEPYMDSQIREKF